MHSLLTSSDGFLLAQWSPIMLWDAIWPYLVMMLGFSVIVFTHELGHFAVAKWAGVRVDKFAIGFGRELFGFTWGETRYSFNILPLGGYVKMLGQEDFEDKGNELRFKADPRSFINKSVGCRMAIVSAGVIMNILFAFLLFMVVFLIGMEAVAPRIAFVEPDSPAEKAGLQPGDLIREINGEAVLEFKEVQMAVLLASLHEPIEFIVQRGGVIQPPIYIRPEYRKPRTTRDIRRQVVGIGSGVTPEILAVGPEIDTSRADQPHVGDRLVEVAGIEVTDQNASEIYNMLAYTTQDVFVERKDPNDPKAPPRRVQVDFPPMLALYASDPRDPSTYGILGLAPLVRFGPVGPSLKGRAYVAGLELGDTVLSWDDQPHPKRDFIARSIRDQAERDIPFKVKKADGRIVAGFVRPKRHVRGPATIQAICRTIEQADVAPGRPRARFEGVRRGGPAARAGIEDGDMILRCGELGNPTCREVNRATRGSRDKAVSLEIKKSDGRAFETLVTPQAPGVIDAIFALVADDLLMTGEIVPTINGRTSPASEAGIPAGARIVSVNDTQVGKWIELILALRENGGTTVQLAYIGEDQQRVVVPFLVPHSIRTLLDVGPEARILTIDGRETVTLPGDLPETVSVRYHEGTRAILTELIGRRQVPVQYRENLLSELKTAHIEVTADMVDPWLGRITFSPNVLLADETVMLKGENALEAVLIGIHKTYYFIRQVYLVMERMFFTRSVGFDSVSGPLGIIDLGGQVARAGLVKFLFFLAIISANLAVINFLPLPIVDGGLMVFLIIEKIKGSPVSLRVQVATQVIGLALIIGVFALVTYQDVLRMFG